MKMKRQCKARGVGRSSCVHSSALGLWKEAQSRITARDDLILVEEMAETFDRAYCSA